MHLMTKNNRQPSGCPVDFFVGLSLFGVGIGIGIGIGLISSIISHFLINRITSSSKFG